MDKRKETARKLPWRKLYSQALKRYDRKLIDHIDRSLDSETKVKQLVELQIAELCKTKVEKHPQVTRIIWTNNWKIGIVSETVRISCHPHPASYPPVIRVNRKNHRMFIQLHEGTYRSNNHLNKLSQWIQDIYATADSIYILIKEHLFRHALQFKDAYVNYLVGFDDGSVFTERVPSTVSSVQEAIEWLKPAEVKKAEQEGRMVLRQGDVFFVETKRSDITKYQLPQNHEVKVAGDTVFITHHEHQTLKLPHRHFKPVQRKTVASIMQD